MYYHKWFPRFFYKKYDGGKESGVTGYFLLEWKPVFSIGLLHFKKGSRENFHSHAFNACTWWLKGAVLEIGYPLSPGGYKEFCPSLKPKTTKRSKIHKVVSHQDTWALTFRGPWKDSWFEVTPDDKLITLTHNRVVLSTEQK